jgi:hypothetical protein
MATISRGEGVWLLPQSRWEEYRLPPRVLLRGIDHQQDWVRACKGGAPEVSDFSVASKYIEWRCPGAGTSKGTLYLTGDTLLANSSNWLYYSSEKGTHP